MSLASISTLLPSHTANTEHPPIFLRLNEAALDALVASIEHPGDISLSISDCDASLRIRDTQFDAMHYKEPGSIQVYMPEEETENAFRSFGFVQSRVNVHQIRPAGKRKLAQDVQVSKRAKPSHEEMLVLARKFRKTYKEYLELYGKLSNPKQRPASQLQRLMALHKQLGQWKKTLWLNAPSKQIK